MLKKFKPVLLGLISVVLSCTLVEAKDKKETTNLPLPPAPIVDNSTRILSAKLDRVWFLELADKNEEVRALVDLDTVSEKPVGQLRVMTTTRLYFANYNGVVIKKIKVPDNTNFSQQTKNGRYIYQMKVTAPYGHGKEELARFVDQTVLDKDGNSIWSSRAPNEYGVLVDRDRIIHLYETQGSSGFIKFYKQDKMIKKTGNFPTDGLLYWDYSLDGNYFALGVNKQIDLFNWKGYFYFYNTETGEEVWKQPELASRFGKVIVSPKGNYVILIAADDSANKRYICVMDKSGKVVGVEECGFLGNYIAKFTDDEKVFVVTSSGRDQVYYFVTQPKVQLLWKYENPKGQRGFLALDLVPDGKMVVLSGTSSQGIPESSSGPRRIMIFNDSGEIIAEKSVEDHNFRYWTDTSEIKFADKGKLVIMALKGKVVGYRNLLIR